MKKKIEAKRGLSTGGKGFSLNPKVKCSDVNSTTVKSSRHARQNLVKRAVCFSGSEGIQCERVWDGTRAPDCMGSGDSMTQNEYLEKKRTNAASCKNVVINFLNAKANISEVIVEYDTEKAVYEIEFLGKKYQVDWNHSNSYIGSVLSTIGGIEINSSLECVASNSLIAVVGSANSNSNKYVFNAAFNANNPIQPIGGYTSDLSFGLYDGNYTIDNPHILHPIAFLNKDPNNGNIFGLTYTVDDSEPIIIKVSGGSDSLTSGDTFTFRDSNDNPIIIGDSVNGFRFMRHRTYRFINNGINNGFGMKINIDGVETDTLGYTGSSTNNITNVSTPESAVTVNGNQYRLNGATGTTDVSFGMTDGTYRLTGIPEANPLGIVSGNGLTYSVDDSAGPIVINVTGGSTSANGGGDYYTFTDSGGNSINLGNGGFKFMRGRSYRFQVGTGGITDGHQFKLYANGALSANGLGNSVATSTPAGCLDPSVDVDVTAIKGTTNYNLSTFNVYDGTYRFTNISQSDPIAFLNAGVAGISYRVDDSTPIYISVDTPIQSPANNDDYYSFTLATDSVGTPGTPIRIRDGTFKFMRGQVYHFIVAPGGGLGAHPFVLYNNGSPTNSIVSSGEYIEIQIDENHPFDPANLPYAPTDQLYYRCVAHGTMKADMALSVLDVGAGVVYDFFYGTVIVTIDSAFDGEAAVKFRDLDGDESNNGLTYSSSCQVSAADGVSVINVTIGAGHGTGAGDLRYVHQSEGNVNMSLTAIDVGGGMIVDHFYGDIDVVVNGDFGDASVRNLAGNFVGGTNLITYGQSQNIGDTGVSSVDINIPSGATNQNNLYYKTFQSGSEIVDVTNSPIRPKIYFLYKSVETQSYDFYYGKIHVNVYENFGDMSVYCYYDGHMGGKNLLTYTDKCDVNLRGTADGFGPATLIVKSFNNTGVRTVELIKKLGEDTVLTFKNPEAYIFEPVGCGTISAGSGLGGTAGADNRGHYGRGRCKVFYINKSPQFQPKTYTGIGGYLDKLKRPNTDISFCG